MILAMELAGQVILQRPSELLFVSLCNLAAASTSTQIIKALYSFSSSTRFADHQQRGRPKALL